MSDLVLFNKLTLHDDQPVSLQKELLEDNLQSICDYLHIDAVSAYLSTTPRHDSLQPDVFVQPDALFIRANNYHKKRLYSNSASYFQRLASRIQNSATHPIVFAQHDEIAQQYKTFLDVQTHKELYSQREINRYAEIQLKNPDKKINKNVLSFEKHLHNKPSTQEYQNKYNRLLTNTFSDIKQEIPLLKYATTYINAIIDLPRSHQEQQLRQKTPAKRPKRIKHPFAEQLDKHLLEAFSQRT